MLSKPIHPEQLRRWLRLVAGLPSTDVAPAPTVALQPMQVPRGSSGRLLLAEDNVTNQKVAVAMLTGAPYQVDTVVNGKAAVRAAADQPYDAILMDCQMPELNGYQATAAIRAQEGQRQGQGRRTPIIAMTAGARREDRERCLAEGMDHYLAKPVSRDVLLAMVTTSMAGPSIPAPLSRLDSSVPDLEVPLDTHVLGDLGALSVAGEPDLLAALVEQFVLDTGPLLVRLRDAVEVGDATTVRRISHGTRGSGGQLGGRRFASSCARLEASASGDRLAGSCEDLLDVDLDYEELRAMLADQLCPLER